MTSCPKCALIVQIKKGVTTYHIKENLEKQRNLTQYHKPAEINQRRDVGTYSINVEGKLYRQDIEQTTRKNNNIRYG